jgi:hypothetical protein
MFNRHNRKRKKGNTIKKGAIERTVSSKYNVKSNPPLQNLFAGPNPFCVSIVHPLKVSILTELPKRMMKLEYTKKREGNGKGTKRKMDEEALS